MAFNVIFPLRVAQTLLTIILLGLTAYGTPLSALPLFLALPFSLTLPSCKRLVRMVLLRGQLVPQRSKLPPLLLRLDHPRLALPHHHTRPFAHRSAQVRHPSRRTLDHDILACGVDCDGCAAGGRGV